MIKIDHRPGSGRGRPGGEGRLSRTSTWPGGEPLNPRRTPTAAGSGLRFPCPAARPPPGETQGREAEEWNGKSLFRLGSVPIGAQVAAK